MKTIVIWNEGFEKPLRFFVLDGDKSKFNCIFVNGFYSNPEEILLETELSDLVFDANGNTKVELMDKFPVALIANSIADDSGPVVVIEAGFIP